MVTVAIERVDPHSIVEHAAAVLDEAWSRPCFHYTPGYLAWQFQYPSPLLPCAFGAFDGSRLVGFIGLCARRALTSGNAQDVCMMSFGSVLPSFRGQGIASRLYEAVLRAVEPTGADVMAFAETGSPAEYVFAKVARRVRKDVRTLSPLRGCAAAVGPLGNSAAGKTGTDSELARLLVASTRNAIAWNNPTGAQLAHYADDPRGAAFLTTEDAHGISGAIATLYEVISLTGVERVPVLDSVFLPTGQAQHLRDLAASASRRWPAATSSVVMLPNAGTIAASVLREAGFRSTKASFTPYILSNDPASPLLGADATNLEII
jgi:GNAT superfamily N-acetyltransferase